MLKTAFTAVLTFLLMTLALAEAPVPLSVDKAFVLSTHVDPDHGVWLEWSIAPGYYLYRSQLKVMPLPHHSIDIHPVQLPAGQMRHDVLHGDYQAYTGSLKVPVIYPVSQQGELDLIVRYQGCSSRGFCYPPVKKMLKIDLSDMAVIGDLNKSPASDSDMASFFEGRHLLAILFSFLGMGLLLAFTPCILPIVPILSGIIMGQNQKKSQGRSFCLSLAYVGGMAITYMIAGMVIALIGQNIQAELQRPWIVVLFSGLLVLLALSLFDFYDFRLPGRFQREITALSNRQCGGTYIGVFLMGSLSTLIVSPCVSAPLIGVLAYIGQTGDVLLGALALLALGVGMGIPLLLIGLSADRLLPKTGPWMIWLKRFFGFLMLGMAIWMLSRVMPGSSNPIFTSVHTTDELSQQLLLAKKNHQPVLLDFYANWCGSCVMMDRTVFSRSDVRDALKKMIVLRVDLTQNTAFDQRMLKQFDIVGPPGMIFFNQVGHELTSPRIIGEVNADTFLRELEKVSHRAN